MPILVIFYASFPGHYQLCAGLFAVASLTDFLDGHLDSADPNSLAEDT